MLSEEIREELDVSRLVYAAHVSECSRNAKVGSDRAEGLVYVINVLRLGVQARIIGPGVVDTILLTPSDADLHFEPETGSLCITTGL